MLSRKNLVNLLKELRCFKMMFGKSKKMKEDSIFEQYKEKQKLDLKDDSTTKSKFDKAKMVASKVNNVRVGKCVASAERKQRSFTNMSKKSAGKIYKPSIKLIGKKDSKKNYEGFKGTNPFSDKSCKKKDYKGFQGRNPFA